MRNSKGPSQLAGVNRREVGFAPLLIVVVIAIFAVIGIIIVGSINKSTEPPSFIRKLTEDGGFSRRGSSNLPECDDRYYSVPIVDIDEISSITPLGNLNPPEHTTPTNHMYINLNSVGVPLKAPGDIVVTSISSSENKERGTTDYSLEFSLCKDVHGYFIHIKTLTPELLGLLTEDNCELYGEGNKYKNCWAGVQKKLKAGDIIGTVGNSQQGNFDFGTYDTRTQLDYVNPDRYAPPGDSSSKSLSLVCPLDYYSEPYKQNLFDKVERQKLPICGEVEQDVAGTLQGNWFFGDASATAPESWNSHLTFGYENTDPDIAVISIGGVFTRFGTFSFLQKTDGRINRAFDEVKPDGQTYCYESADNVASESPRTDGKVLVKLVSDTELQIEHQPGSCSGDYSFTNPTTYER